MKQLSDDELQAYLLGQTSTIDFVALQPNFARGQCIWLAPSLDLLQVAKAMIQDHAEQIKAWQQQGLVKALPDQQAEQWLTTKAQVWALVVTPWVLVQDLNKD